MASDLPGYRVVARPDVEALLVSPNDARALATAVNRLLTDRCLADRLVSAGERRAQEFAMENLARQYLDLYQTLL